MYVFKVGHDLGVENLTKKVINFNQKRFVVKIIWAVSPYPKLNLNV